MSRRSKQNNPQTLQPDLQTQFKGVDMTSAAESEQTLNNKQRFWDSLKKSIEKAFGTKPTQVHGQDDWRTEFYKEHLKHMLMGIIKVEVKADWDIDYFKKVLLFEGKICTTEINGTNYALRCGTHGVSAYDRANYINIANPVLGTHDRVNGIDAVIIYCLDKKRYSNFSMLVDIFACKLAMCDAAIDVNLFNSKMAYAIKCSSKKQADEAKLIYDKINSGEPAVFYDNNSIDVTKDIQFFNGNVKQNFVSDLIQQQKRAIVAEFLTKIGVNSSNSEKKERMLYDEVNANNMEVMVNIDWCEELIKSGVEEANKMFPYLGLKITFPYLELMRKKESEKADDTTGHDDSDGAEIKN